MRPPLMGLLREVPIFKELEEDLLLELLAHSRRRKFESDETLFHEGDPGQTLYVIISGHLRIQRASSAGRVVHLAHRGPGQHVGELSLIDSEPRMADAVTMEPCELLMLDRVDFLQCLDRAPRAAFAVMTSLAKRLRQAADDFQDYRELDVLGRLSKAILELFQSHGAGESLAEKRINAPITQQDLANQVGTTPESISRAISSLKSAGAIRFEGRKLIVLNEEKLRNYAGQS